MPYYTKRPARYWRFTERELAGSWRSRSFHPPVLHLPRLVSCSATRLFPCIVLASFRPLTYPRGASDLLTLSGCRACYHLVAATLPPAQYEDTGAQTKEGLR
jgi:hypothetical protein